MSGLRMCVPRAQVGRVVYGEIEALSPIARLVIRGPRMSRPVAVRGRWFVGSVPPGTGRERWRLIAYGRGGNILGRIYL